jgi:hypothetical protein
MITLSAFRWLPPLARGLVRDLRVRWALEEAGIPYQERLIGPEDHRAAHPAPHRHHVRVAGAQSVSRALRGAGRFPEGDGRSSQTVRGQRRLIVPYGCKVCMRLRVITLLCSTYFG